ncbi:MAG: hypothetical protein IPK00_12205 [Deltaproteobacteria bacterium]|nr:hypothetical protein [Deltaproteobacteria bacterium]
MTTDAGEAGAEASGRRAVPAVPAPRPDPADRPGASGHRFGPGLVCSECGVRWDAHQRSPHPCTVDLPHDPFARRPLPPAPVESTRRSRPPAVEPDDGDEGGER